MARAKDTSVWVATQSFASEKGDAVQGQHFRGDHDLVRTYPAFFARLDGEPVVEEAVSATAAPGEKRA